MNSEEKWIVRERRDPAGNLRDCFVEAPKTEGMAYGLEVLGDNYTGYGDQEGKLEHCRRIVACVNACRPLTTESLEMHGLAGITSSTERILREQCDTAMDERIAAGKRIEEMERQRDELLKALEGVLPFLTGEYWPGVIADAAVDFAVATARKVAAAKVTQS